MIAKGVVQMFGAEEVEEGSPHDPQQAGQRRKQLVFELNRSGQYLRLKEQLKAGVVAIVKESYHKSGSMGRQEMQASLTSLPSHYNRPQTHVAYWSVVWGAKSLSGCGELAFRRWGLLSLASQTPTTLKA